MTGERTRETGKSVFMNQKKNDTALVGVLPLVPSTYPACWAGVSAFRAGALIVQENFIAVISALCGGVFCRNSIFVMYT